MDYTAVLAAAFICLSYILWHWWTENTASIMAAAYHPLDCWFMWNRHLLALHVVSDAVIFLSYMAISASLAWLLYRVRRQIECAWILVAFGVFILACGITHGIDLLVIWRPMYWVLGGAKLVTAIASLTTAVTLPCLFPVIRRLLEQSRSSDLNARRFLAISESSNDGFFLLESVRDAAGQIAHFRFVFINEKGASLLSGTAETVQGQLLCVRHPVNRTHGFFEMYKHVVNTGEQLDLVTPIDAEMINASWLRLQAVRFDDGIVITTNDISQRK